MAWTADITNDPEHDFDLIIELLENDEYQGRIERQNGVLVVRFYSLPDLTIPAVWLRQILTRAEEDLKCEPLEERDDA